MIQLFPLMAFDKMLLLFITISIVLTCVCCGAKCNKSTFRYVNGSCYSILFYRKAQKME